MFLETILMCNIESANEKEICKAETRPASHLQAHACTVRKQNDVPSRSPPLDGAHTAKSRDVRFSRASSVRTNCTSSSAAGPGATLRAVADRQEQTLSSRNNASLNSKKGTTKPAAQTTKTKGTEENRISHEQRTNHKDE